MSASTAADFCLSNFTQVRCIGSVYRGTAKIVIAELLIDEILDFSESGRDREVGGFLLGNAYGEIEPFVMLRHFHPASFTREGSASLVFTHETWADLHRQAEVKYPGQRIMGWQHTHPGFGVFLSGYDEFIHRNFFRDPHQVALVVDPRRQEFGFFHWRQDQLRDCGFLCVSGP